MSTIITPSHKTWIIYDAGGYDLGFEPVLFFREDQGHWAPVTPKFIQVNAPSDRMRPVMPPIMPRVYKVVAAEDLSEAEFHLRKFAAAWHGCPKKVEPISSIGDMMRRPEPPAAVQYAHVDNCTMGPSK